jgi:hypothetical protein
VYSALEHISEGALITMVPALLIARFIWPRRIPWWSVILTAMLVGTALDMVLDHFARLAHFERYDSCIRAAAPGEGGMCGYGTYDVMYTPVYLKWALGIFLLVAYSPFYALAVWLRSRRRRVAAA